MKRTMTMPIATAVLAVAGFALRKWHLAAAWEEDTGFTIPGTPANWALWGFLALTAAVLFLLARQVKGGFSGYLSAFQSPMKVWAVLNAVAGAITAIGGVFWLMERRESGWLEAALGVSFILSGAAMSYLGLVNQRKRETRELVVSLAPGYAACLWLVEVYQRNTAHPELMEYVFYLLGVVAAILALYTMAGFSFEKKTRPRRFCWYAGMAVVLLFTDLADQRGNAVSLVEMGTAVFLYAQMTTLLFRAAFPAELETPETSESPESQGKSENPESQENPEENGGLAE